MKQTVFSITIIVLFCAVVIFLAEPSYGQSSTSIIKPESAPIAKPYSNETDIGVVLLSGNSPSDSYNIKQISIYKWDFNTVRGVADYLQTRSVDPNTGDSVETAFKWDVGARYEFSQNATVSYFGGYLLESNVYAGFLRRHNTDLGAKILLEKTPNYEVFGEPGYRYIHQDNTDETHDYSNNLRLYIEGNYHFNPTSLAQLWVEYLANVNRVPGWKTNGEVSVSSAMNTWLSLKVAYLVNHDDAPPAGKKKTDTTFTTALVSKF